MTRPKNVQSVEYNGRIDDALEAYKSGNYKSYRAAARAFDVSKTTLMERAKGRITRNLAHEDQQILSAEEEIELAQWITRLTLCGYPPKPYTVKEMAETIRTRRTLGINDLSAAFVNYNKIGEQWVSRFLTRHPELSAVMPEQIDAARVKETSYAVLNKWFVDVESIIRDYNIQPRDIYNMDETGYSIGSIKATRVIIDKTKNIRYSAIPGRQEWVSVIESISMDGIALPPFIIFKGKTLTGKWLAETNAPLDWIFSVNSRGWTSDAHMKKWLTQTFEPITRDRANGRTRLLIFDGHGSHTTTDVIRHCILNNIQLALLPPHTSHKTQPLDVGVFSSMKSHMTRECDRFFRTQLPRIEKAEWLTAFIKARPLAFTAKNIASGWSGTGLRPFNPRIVLSQVPLPLPVESPPLRSTPEFESPFLNPDLTSSPIDTPAQTLANTEIKQRAHDRSIPFDTPARTHVVRLVRTLNRSFARNRIQGQELSELREIHTTRKCRQSGKYNILRGETIIATPDMLQRLEKGKVDSKPKSKRQKVTHSPPPPAPSIENLLDSSDSDSKEQ